MEERARKLGPEALLELSSHYLSLRDFATARMYALLIQQNYPNRQESDQIIAVADVLLAAEKRLHNNELDWFAILQVQNRSDCDIRPAMRTQFKKLAILLSPSKNLLPFSQDAFKLVCDAWAALSNRQKKTQYNNGLENDGDKQNKQEDSVEREPKNGKIRTFWTVCPYCYYLYEYERVYEECCLRCQNCQRAFHGVAVPVPPSGMVVEGKEQYHGGFGYFPLQYCWDGFLAAKKDVSSGDGGGDDGCLGKKKGNNGELKGGLEHVVEISDGSDCGEKDKDSNCVNIDGVGLKEEMVKNWVAGVKGNVSVVVGVSEVQGNERSQVRNDVKKVMRRKSVAINTKKLMGTGKKIRRLAGIEMVDRNMEFGEGTRGTGEERKSDGGDGSSENDLEFFFEEDDIYVGFKNAA